MASDSSPGPGPLSGQTCELIRAHLEEILQSEAFAGSRRSQEFLRYVVNETLAGRGAGIKERNIALDVFGRTSDFNSQRESIVRVKAVEVRRRLAQAYENTSAGGLQIELPVGAYQPVFRFAVPAAVPAAKPEPAPQHRAKPWWVFALAVLAIVLVGGFVMRHNSEAPVGKLWDGFADQDRPVLLSLPAPTVLELEHKETWLPLRAGESVPSDEMRAKENYYVGVGAALGAARFAEQLTLRGQPFIVKFGSDVTFADLKQSPALLLGAFTSAWTIEMTRRLRFRFDTEDTQRSIVDSWPGGRHWREVNVPPVSEPEDGYALITRMVNSDAGHPLLMAAGISALDTQAAVEFLTREPYFDAFARVAPRDWIRRNFQIVIRTKIHGHSAGQPSMDAWYVW